VRHADRPIKLLGDGDLERRLTISLDAVSRSAAAAVSEAGGTVRGADEEASG
jgi:large subunit ribosomal protein L15